MKNAISSIPDLVLERYLLKEMPASHMEAIGEALASDIDAQKRLEELKRSNTEILDEYPVADMMRDINMKYEKSLKIETWQAEQKSARKPFLTLKNFYKGAIIGTPVLATLIVVLLAVNPWNSSNMTTPESYFNNGKNEIIYVKGEPQLIIFRKKGNQTEKLNNNTIAKEKDQLQIFYVHAGRKYGVIVSIDGAGNTTLHYPLDKNDIPLLDTSTNFASVPSSYELDNAPLFEKFYFVTSRKEITVEKVMNAAQKLAGQGLKSEDARLELPQGYEQNSFLIKKGGE